MRKLTSRPVVILVLLLAAAASTTVFRGSTQSLKPNAKETHLRNIRQLTHGGTNAEAYFSADGKNIIFQSTREPYK